jgi:septum formation protein
MISILQNKFEKIILASQSPRRRELMAKLGLQFESISLDVDESFPDNLEATEVAPYLAQKKSASYTQLMPGELLITCDTTVCLAGKVINKPTDRSDAFSMLSQLSGNTHTVVTGVTLKTTNKELTFNSHTKVSFNLLTKDEIEYYVNHFEVLDKAGAYGIQDWIGYSNISKIEGCYYNVMGLPTYQLFSILKDW